MPNFVDNIDLFDASGDPTNILLQDRTTLALLSSTVARINSLLVYNVKDYGAVGDGVTDDTEAFNATIAAANATGGTILIPKGNYVISDELTPITAAVSIVGNEHPSILSSIPQDDVLLTVNSADVAIKNIYFENATKNGVCIETGLRTIIEKCIFANYDTQIHVFESSLVKIIGNYMVNAGSYQILIQSPSYPDTGDNLIAFNTFDANVRNFANIRIDSGGGLYIQNNKMMNARYAIYEAIDVSPTSIMIISGNSIENYTEAGVYLGSPLNDVTPFAQIIINGNQFATPTGTAVTMVDKSHSILINNNSILAANAESQYAFIISSPDKQPDSIKIANNLITNFYGGVLFNGDTKDCTIEIESKTMTRPIFSIVDLDSSNIIKVKATKEYASGTNLLVSGTMKRGSSFKQKITLMGATSNHYKECVMINNSGTPSATDIVENADITNSFGADTYLTYGTTSENVVMCLEMEGLVNTINL